MGGASRPPLGRWIARQPLSGRVVGSWAVPEHWVRHLSQDQDRVYVLGIGGNLGDVHRNFLTALARLAAVDDSGRSIELIDSSMLYETPPMYVTDQGAFLNAVICVKTRGDPMWVLDTLKGVEAEAGRDFDGQRYGPRYVYGGVGRGMGGN